MAKCYCECGAKYQVAEASLGKKAKCKRCGVAFTLKESEDGTIAIAEEIGLGGEVDAAVNRAHAVTEAAAPVSAAYLPSSETSGRLGPVVIETADRSKSYGRNILGAFLFPKSLHNALTFIVVWVVFFVLTLMLSWGATFSLFALIFYLAFLGWWAAYRFSVVASGAAGDDDLPNPGGSEAGVGGFLMTLLQWVGSWLVVLLPAIVFAIIAFTQGWMDVFTVTEALYAGVAGLLFIDGGGAAAAFAGLVVLGMFFWPMIILCVAIGGFGCISRLDLIFRTIVKTFPVYLFTAAMVFGIDWLGYALGETVDTRLSADQDATISSFLGSSMLVSFLVKGITVYSEIVAMKLIGLYYHHFKYRFAWSWE